MTIDIGKWLHWFSHIERGHDDDDCHTVKVAEGGSLWQIAEKMTGDGNRWHELVAANPGRNFDEHYTLKVGEELRVPKSWGEG